MSTENILNMSTEKQLPEVPGAKIDRSSLTIGNGGVLVHYISTNPDFTTVTMAIIVVHGVNRDAYNAFATVQGAVKTANKGDVIIMAVSTPFSINFF